MTNANDRMAGARRSLAEMEALIAACTPTPKKVESGIRRGKKHSGQIFPVPEEDRFRPAKRDSANPD